MPEAGYHPGRLRSSAAAGKRRPYVDSARGTVYSAERWPGFVVSLTLDNYAGAGFVLRCAPDEAWARGDSNP